MPETEAAFTSSVPHECVEGSEYGSGTVSFWPGPRGTVHWQAPGAFTKPVALTNLCNIIRLRHSCVRVRNGRVSRWRDWKMVLQ